MSNRSILPQRRSRGRPKKSVNYASLAGFTNLNRPSTFSSKRKQAPTEDTSNFPSKRKQESSQEIQIISSNGITTIPGTQDTPEIQIIPGTQVVQIKPSKLDDQPKRCLPHRAARFQDSYDRSPDVVVVSDEENQEEESESESDSDCGPVPSPILMVKTKEEQLEWESNIQRLKKELNDEEMKLVLLRKLKDSQKAKDGKSDANGSPTPSVVSVNSVKSHPTPVFKSNNAQLPQPPSKQLLANRFIPVKKEPRTNPVTTTNNGPQRHSSPGPISLVKNENYPSTHHSAASSSSSNQLKANTLNQQYPLLKNLSNQITVTPVPSVPSPSVPSPSVPSVKIEEKIDAEAIYQRQAAAKLALRKQLEKTLLQIPLPKPPPLKINFFPNSNSVEFLCLLGLDYVVDFLTRAKKEAPRKMPLCCAQCSTDFTCAWKWKEIDKNGKKVFDVFCEACINSNIRKSLKAQHTNNLKAAFLKALQQEKEIDRLSQTIPKSHSSTPREPRQKSHHHQQHPHPVPAPAHQQHNTSAFSVPKSGTTLTYIPKPSSPMNLANMGQVGKLNPQFHSLLQAQAQHLLASGVPLHPNVLSLTSFMPQSTHSQGKSSTGQHDHYRRQYRQDRTQSPSLPTASSSWKA